MYFDNLTLAGLLITLPYVVMLFMFGKEKSTGKQQETFVLDCSDEEFYRYGT
jgi:hypothetical protein